ncbi:hypothetical protein F5Y04DRAFT_281824 [Hypomontagnella monticulosa]|nr:hypothetical protein F5Y04DRAFT_281824 [Hypomontagnella monticulosa]
MQLNTLLLAALASSISTASYNIKLYEHRNCLFTVGKQCSGVDARTCCGDGEKYKSAKFEEQGASSSDDQLKLYTDSNCDGFAVQQHTGTCCLSHDEKEVLGAQVFVVINARDEKTAGPTKMAKPDEVFMEDRRFRYTLKRDSTQGKAYENLTRIEDQVEHLRTFGKRERME